MAFHPFLSDITARALHPLNQQAAHLATMELIALKNRVDELIATQIARSAVPNKDLLALKSSIEGMVARQNNEALRPHVSEVVAFKKEAEELLAKQVAFTSNPVIKAPELGADNEIITVETDQGPIRMSLHDSLVALVYSHAPMFDKQAEQHYDQMSEVNETMKKANRLLQLVHQASDSDLSADLSKVEGAKEIIANLKQHEFEIDTEKMVYSRDERQDLVKAIEHFVANLNNEMKLTSQKCQQCLQNKGTVYESCCTCMKNLKDLSKMIFQALAGK